MHVLVHVNISLDPGAMLVTMTMTFTSVDAILHKTIWLNLVRMCIDVQVLDV